MRHRSKSDLHSGFGTLRSDRIREEWTNLPENFGVLVNSVTTVKDPLQTLAFDHYGEAEEMDDIVSGGHGRDHPVLHTKDKWDWQPEVNQAGPWRPWIRDVNPPNHYYRDRYTVTWTNGYYSNSTMTPGAPAHDLNILPASSDFEPLVAEHAMKCMLPLAESVSLGNFLLEVGETHMLLESLRKLLNRYLTGDLRIFDPTDPLLGYNFGFKPLISDLVGIYRALTNLQSNVNWIMANANKRVRVVTERYYTPDPVYAPSSDPLPSSGTGTYVGGRCVTNMFTTLKLISWIEYDLHDFGRLGATIAAVLRSLGLSNPGKVAWQSMPLSFVADWVLDVSKLLNHCDLMGTLLSTKIVKTTSHMTVKSDTDFYTKLYEAPYFPALVDEDVIVGSRRKEFYRRWTGIPSDTGFILTAPRPMQQLLLLLLGNQARKRGRSKPFFVPTEAWFRRKR